MDNVIPVDPISTKRFNVTLKESDKDIVSDSIVFFKGTETKHGLIFMDSLFQKDYPWSSEPLRVTVLNPNPWVEYIETGEKIGTLKALWDEELPERPLQLRRQGKLAYR